MEELAAEKVEHHEREHQKHDEHEHEHEHEQQQQPLQREKTVARLLKNFSGALGWIEQEHKLWQECCAIVQELGTDYKDSNGDTLLHIYIQRIRDRVAFRSRALPIYVFAQCGVPMNEQNHLGDTPLHLATRYLSRFPEVYEALLQCGADPDARNQFAQTPRSEVEHVASLHEVLKKYEPTLIQCVMKGPFNYKSMQDCVRKWYAVNTNVQNGLTIMDIVRMYVPTPNKDAMKAKELLKQQHAILKLVHAVLANDRDRVMEAAQWLPERYTNINIRHFSRCGKTPLLCAIWNNSLPIVTMLLANGANARARVRYNAKSAYEGEDQRTTTVLHLALDKDVQNFDVFQALAQSVSFHDYFERNSESNTLILEALENDRSLEEIRYILADLSKFVALADRNAHGENLREICRRLARNDVDELIQRSLLQLMQDRASRNSREILIHLASSYLGTEFFKLSDAVKEPSDAALLDDFVCKIAALESKGQALFKAINANDLETAKRYNIANFRDKAGQTALIKAIIYERRDFVEWLLVERPELKYIADNKNRFPLHYAHLLPDGLREEIVGFLVEEFQASYFDKAKDNESQSYVYRECFETRMFDENGRLPADYKRMREELLKDMFYVEVVRPITILDDGDFKINLESE